MRIFTGFVGLVFCVVGVWMSFWVWALIEPPRDQADIGTCVMGTLVGVYVATFGVLNVCVAIIGPEVRSESNGCPERRPSGHAHLERPLPSRRLRR